MPTTLRLEGVAETKALLRNSHTEAAASSSRRPAARDPTPTLKGRPGTCGAASQIRCAAANSASRLSAESRPHLFEDGAHRKDRKRLSLARLSAAHAGASCSLAGLACCRANGLTVTGP